MEAASANPTPEERSREDFQRLVYGTHVVLKATFGKDWEDVLECARNAMMWANAAADGDDEVMITALDVLTTLRFSHSCHYPVTRIACGLPDRSVNLKSNLKVTEFTKHEFQQALTLLQSLSRLETPTFKWRWLQSGFFGDTAEAVLCDRFACSLPR